MQRINVELSLRSSTLSVYAGEWLSDRLRGNLCRRVSGGRAVIIALK